jgi:hypothetical protein
MKDWSWSNWSFGKPTEFPQYHVNPTDRQLGRSVLQLQCNFFSHCCMPRMPLSKHSLWFSYDKWVSDSRGHLQSRQGIVLRIVGVASIPVGRRLMMSCGRYFEPSFCRVSYKPASADIVAVSFWSNFLSCLGVLDIHTLKADFKRFFARHQLLVPGLLETCGSCPRGALKGYRGMDSGGRAV